MNFFEQQDQAQKSTRKLIAFFCLAIISLVAITTLFIAFFLTFSGGNSTAHSAYGQPLSDLSFRAIGQTLSWELLASVAIIITSLVTIGSLYKLQQLKRGGQAVALALGGKPLLPDTDNIHERKLLNVVEEMAIASGTPVPSVYLLEENAINAFAAGHDPHDAVIGVTRGCMELLDRDELQGVISHEFSHILHGDMRINLRLLGLLHGILLIGLIGSMLARSGSHRSHYRSSGKRNGSGIILLGWGLVIIGYSGTFFGKLIKSAISRQREFLADANAVQYTRNPHGISQALQKIGGCAYGSQLFHPNTEQFSHMYFGESNHSMFSDLMATHPPLEVRIKRITPAWNGQFPSVNVHSGGVSSPQAESGQSGYSGFSGSAQNAGVNNSLKPSTASDPADTIDSVANPSPAHLNRAREILTALPASLKEGANNPFTARAIVYNLLINADQNSEIQWQQLQQRAHPVVYKTAVKLKADVEALSSELKLPLFELTIPALRGLSKPQYDVFKSNVIALIRADKAVNIFEWALYRILLNALEDRPHQHNSLASLTQLAVPIQQLLSTLTHAGHREASKAEDAFNNSMQELKLSNLPLLGQELATLPMLDGAITQLRSLKPLKKPALLKALISCIQHDGQITPREFELFRAIADSLDCPVPPLTSQ